MRIKKRLELVKQMAKQVRTLSAYRKFIDRLPEFRLVSPELTEESSRLIGFEGLPEIGDSIVPSVIGPATNFNARGREVVRRDLPKETLSRMVNASWPDWHGYMHHGVQMRTYEAYPRDQIPPPGEFLTALLREGSIIAASRVLRRDEAEGDIVHVINIFLECFPSFDIVRPDLTQETQVRKLNWLVLPPGPYPFDRARQALDEYLQGLQEDERATATERIAAITRHNPDFIAVGVGGFSDYVVFGFTANRRYVLESPNTGNATYIFRDEWEQFSQLSKAQILQGGLQEARLVHNGRWHFTLGQVINSP